MQHFVSEQIEHWFRSCNGDGSFMDYSRSLPYSTIGLRSATSRWVYSTKPQTLCHLVELGLPTDNFGIIGRCGLPNVSDFYWLSRLIGENPILFLGDLDPVDLMIFAWLRERIQPKSISFHGIGDSLLGALNIIDVAPYRINLSPPELRALRDIGSLVPDYETLIGERCTAVLQSKGKLEVDCLVSFHADELAQLLNA